MINPHGSKSFGIGKPERYKAVMDNTLKAVRRYFDTGERDEIITGLDQPDVHFCGSSIVYRITLDG